MKRPSAAFLLILLGFVLLTGCGGKEFEFQDAAQDASELYAKFKGHVDNARFEIATKYFDELESRYPFSPHSLQARLDLAYGYVLFGRPEDAVSEADKFIRFNPTHKDVDYAYYIRGIANFGNRKQFLANWFPRNSSDFELTSLHDAYNDFDFILRNFPNSRYAADARQRMVFLRNMFAEHEIHVAEYYISRTAWVAAANRANNVLHFYPTTPYNRDALEILLQCYRKLGLDQSAADTEKILQLNYPNDPKLQANGDES